MSPHENTSGACGSGQCGCATSRAEPERPGMNSAETEVPSINGVRLHGPGERLSADELRERACTELLRQAAVRQGRLPATTGSMAQPLGEAERLSIEAMLDDEVRVPVPDRAACERHYQAQRSRFVVGQASRVRHILFAVTPGVDVQRLAQRAEAALLELTQAPAGPGRFEALARTLSNCPSGQQGGELGWLTPEDCAPELARALFHPSDSGAGMGLGLGLGLHPRLVHSRYGLHIIEVLERREGELPPFEAVADRIAAQLALHTRATAWRQYMQLLAGEAEVRGIALEGAATPLVQ